MVKSILKMNIMNHFERITKNAVLLSLLKHSIIGNIIYIFALNLLNDAK